MYNQWRITIIIVIITLCNYKIYIINNNIELTIWNIEDCAAIILDALPTYEILREVAVILIRNCRKCAMT